MVKRIPSVESFSSAIESDHVVQSPPLVAPPIELIEGFEVRALVNDLVGPDGLVEVDVLVSHDNLYEGSRVKLPPSERLVGLIIAGWLDVPLV